MNTARLFAVLALALALGRGACAGKDSCFDCHRVMEGTSRVYTNDIHFAISISCATCHGGDQNETNMNIAMNASRGFKLRVQRPAVPEFCGHCHGDRAYMGRYEDNPRVDQLAKYQSGVHGRLLAGGRKRAAECIDCHGIHNIRKVDDPLSSASPERIAQTCAKCHESTAEAYAYTPHGLLFVDKARPGCTVCHSSHEMAPATVAMLSGSSSVCVRCHKPGSSAAKLAEDMAQFLSNLEAAGPASKDALNRARVAVHSLNLAALKQAAKPLSSSPDSNDKNN